VSFDSTEDQAGVTVVGKRCLDAVLCRISSTGIYIPDLTVVVVVRIFFDRSGSRQTISQPIYDEASSW
jgi:hypothetical protein